ncbi:MAG: YdcF family protein [Bacteroidales bacterium]|nr:YdcF family protein [Bacteroidales bacterium]
MKKLLRFLRHLLTGIGILAVIFVLLSFTDMPYHAYHNLGTKNAAMEVPPDFIVVMGAGGMPSPEGLMRCYYTAQAAHQYPAAKIIVAMPTKPEYFDVSHTYKMYQEIHHRGIDSSRFLFEIEGMNTRQQSMQIAADITGKDTTAVMVVTSPQHMFRSVKAFEKAGFEEVGGIASFERAVERKALKSGDDQEEQSLNNLNLRYNMWNYMKYEITVMREYAAISYYWLRGWI